MGNYLDDLLGIKTVRALGSAPVPQRAALSFEGDGVTLEDNPLLEQTEVTFPALGTDVRAVDVALADSQVITHAQLSTADLVRIVAAGAGPQPIAGIDASSASATRKTLVNLGPAAITLVHASVDAPAAARFRLPGAVDVAMPVDQSFDVVYVPARSGVTAGWRVVL